MCLAVPLKVINMNDLIATVDLYGALKEISLLLLSEEVKTGDYVLVHAGFAIQKVDEDAAKDALNLIKEIAESSDEKSASWEMGNWRNHDITDG
jgi:hydrogenase expression/formation protein HypC